MACVACFMLVCASAQAQDLALDRPASASSTEDDRTDLRPGLANDGDSSTRWSSNYVDNQWWQVDLGSVRQIDRVELNWETAYASSYRIRTSTSSADTWSTAATATISSPGLRVHTFPVRDARYVRIQGDGRATPWGISLWDVGVFGPSSSPPPDDPPSGDCSTGEYLARYWSDQTLSGLPVLSRCEASIDNDFGTGSPPGVPADGFSARYEGSVNFAAANYEFALTGDDGVRLWVDGELVIDRWVNQAATTYRATRAMTAGVHNVRVDYYEASGLAVVRLAATKQLAAPPPPLPSLPPPGAPTLQQVNGGPGYYGQFANALPSGSDYFPIGGWVRPAATQAQIDAYRDFGMNLFVGVECPECANESLIRSNGLKAIIQSNERTRFNDIGSETSGWLLHDEIDMCCGPPGFDGGNGYNMLTSTIGSLPQDGRFRYNNYGKGVMFWESDVDAARFVNEFQQVVSNDIYWFTDPNEAGRPEAKRGSSYGLTVDRMQFLDRMDGREQPVWNFVELGWPFTESAAQGGRRILPAELRSAVWHSIIAGARGILYFDHNFGPSTPGSTILNEGYSDTRAAAKSVNQQIKQLAPVLNAPFVTSGHSATGDVKHMVKWSGGKFYVFAGAHTGGGNATVTIPCVGDATAVVEGESRSIPVQGGSFTDSFADKNAIHIYRIDGGSTCGLGA